MNKKLSRTVSLYLAAIGRKGGRMTSPAKKRSSAENGKLGGRPRKNRGSRTITL